MDRLRRITGCGILGVAMAAGVSSADPTTPKSLEPPGNPLLVLAAHGVGVQIYACQPATDDPALFSWILLAPEAHIADMAGNAVGKHYAGPTWEASDGSQVIGDVVARDAGPDAAAIPWLLLRAKSTAGHGRLSVVSWIQRLHTVGGKAPATGCNSAAAGQEVRVDYSADYNFFAPQS